MFPMQPLKVGAAEMASAAGSGDGVNGRPGRAKPLVEHLTLRLPFTKTTEPPDNAPVIVATED
jgi:hypothetical protein